jgi:hypothetical protein
VANSLWQGGDLRRACGFNSERHLRHGYLTSKQWGEILHQLMSSTAIPFLQVA